MTDLDRFLVLVKRDMTELYMTISEKEEHQSLYDKLQHAEEYYTRNKEFLSYQDWLHSIEPLKQIVERLKNRIKQLEKIPKNDEDFLFTHYNMELKDLYKILGE